jgi:integrase
LLTRTRYQSGTLAVKKRKKGGMVWEFRYYGTGTDGLRERRTATVGTVAKFPTESAIRCSPAVQSLMLRINSEAPESTLEPVTFGAVIARFEKEEMPERYSTNCSYRSNIKNYIRPRWADVPIPSVKAMAVEDWLKRLTLAPKTRSHIRGLMHTIFQCAERWELTDKNPIKLVRVKGGTKRLKRPRVLTTEEFCLIPSRLPEPYRTQVWIAGFLGLRSSEIMPLRWSDFNFSDKTLLVQRSVVHGHVADVKTEYSKDFVPLDPALIEILLAYKAQSFRSAEDWLFANPATGRPYHQDGIQQNYIRKVGIAAGLGDGIGWHTFRHSYRSWLDDTGAPITVQKELMRHASIQTTMNVYGKAMTDSKRQAHSKVVEMVLKSRKSGEVAVLECPAAVAGNG